MYLPNWRTERDPRVQCVDVNNCRHHSQYRSTSDVHNEDCHAHRTGDQLRRDRGQSHAPGQYYQMYHICYRFVTNGTVVGSQWSQLDRALESKGPPSFDQSIIYCVLCTGSNKFIEVLLVIGTTDTKFYIFNRATQFLLTTWVTWIILDKFCVSHAVPKT